MSTVDSHHATGALLEQWHAAYAAAAGDREDLGAFAERWPLSYLATASPDRAVDDAHALAHLSVGHPYVALVDDAQGRSRFTIAVADRNLSLGEILPPLQSLGLEVLTEQPFSLVRPDGVRCWWYDLVLSPVTPAPTAGDRRRIEQAFLAVWSGRTATDPFNQLVTTAGLTWRQTALLRAYGQYLHQLGVPWGRSFTATVLIDHPAIARQLMDLFAARFDPSTQTSPADRAIPQQQLRQDVLAAVDAVENLTADRVLRSYLSLITATVRTNYFGPGDQDTAIALKFDPREVGLVPAPRPRFEVHVSSPRVEGVHLRFGAVARGGLRWSDRQEDLRTEILGLATAQVAKNAVIVPTGAKGGFVLRRPGNRGPVTRDDGLAGYREFVAALLDVHDNLDPVTGDAVRAPGTVAYDGVDAYLVVAADKGTATFSDTANAIAGERGYWLGDAFASGGSAGYDHKAMGITARGAWQSVRRHFAELGVDPETDQITAVGIGDMSGDVFGNGMLLSRTLKLVAAFDHRHIFLDPDPDAATSYAERSRLFGRPASNWADYDPALISAGGGVFPRTVKRIPVTEAVRRSLGLADETVSLSPAEMIRAILAAPVDLWWNGGVGTYVKATAEQDSDAGDKVNDPVRIDATQVRARVVGEGGNLGFTARGRVEFAAHGGHINTDALDNSAGVGSSDREVNIKIALQYLMRQGWSETDRRALLAEMTDQVADLVLAENIRQNELLGRSRQFAAQDCDVHARVLADLQQRRGLDRAQLALPSAAELAERRQQGQGLFSPELAVLTAQVKLDLREQLLGGTVPDDPAARRFLLDYFPRQLSDRHTEAIDRHPLRREIIAAEIVNTVVDTAGLGWVHRMLETSTTADAEDVVRAYLVATEVFGLPDLWRRVHASQVSTRVAGDLVTESIRIIDRAGRWLLQHRPQPLDIGAEIARLAPTVAALSPAVPGWHTGHDDHIDYRHRLDPVIAAGADPDLAGTIYGLLERFCLLDVVEIAHDTGRPASQVAPLYYLVKERRRIDRILTGVSGLPRTDRWTALARLSLRDDLYESIRWIVTRILRTADPAAAPEQALTDWERSVGPRLGRIEAVVTASRTGTDLANLTVAARQVRTLALATTQPS